MNRIKVDSQAVLNALPLSFSDYTVIELHNGINTVVIPKAWENSHVGVKGYHVCLEVYHNATATSTLEGYTPKYVGESASFFYKPKFLYDLGSFLEIYPLNSQNKLRLFKSVHPETRCDFYTGKINMKGR